MFRSKRLDEPLRRLENSQKDGTALLLVAILAVAGATAAAYRVLLLAEAGLLPFPLSPNADTALSLIVLLGWARVAVLTLLAAYEEPVRAVALRFRVLPAVRRMRLDRMTPSGLMKLVAEPCTSGDQAVREAAVARLAQLDIPENRLSLVGDYVSFDGAVSEIAPVVALDLTQRGQLTLLDRKLRRTLQEEGHGDPGLLLRQVMLPVLSVVPERRIVLGRALEQAVLANAKASNGVFPAKVVAELCMQVDALSDEQFDALSRMLVRWQGDALPLVAAARAL